MFRLKKTLKQPILLGLISVAFSLQSCKSGDEKKVETITEKDSDISFNVQPAPEWTEVFQRESGWFGGDGIFAISYSNDDTKANDSILFVFSDTMFGEIEEGKLLPGFTMVNNSIAFYQKGSDPSTVEFYVAENASGEKEAFFIPDAEEDQYYWLGDGFVNPNNEKLYLFSYRIRNLDNDSQFPFEEVGNDLLVIDNKSQLPLQANQKLVIPHSNADVNGTRISFGAGIYTEQDDVFIYGIRGRNKELVVAKTNLENIEDFSSWEFRSKDGWTMDREKMEVLEDSVSNEMSVSKLENGQYALIYQRGGIFPKIYMQLSDSPYGPFGELQEIWDSSTEVTDPDLFTYNAKAHPAISKEGELLVSYNVNSFKFFEIIEDKPQLYRPRFVKIKFNSVK